MIFIRLWVFFAGVLATIFLGWAALVGVPGIQLASVPAQPDLRPYTFEQMHGRAIYIREGCLYCHSQQTRPEGFGADQKLLWGRPAVPGDYVYDQPHLLGTSRTGPDLLNIGARQPSRAWHFAHLYNPRAVAPKSLMPPFPWLFEEKTSVGPADVVVDIVRQAAKPENQKAKISAPGRGPGWEGITARWAQSKQSSMTQFLSGAGSYPHAESSRRAKEWDFSGTDRNVCATREAQDLVEYLLGLNRTYPVKQ